MVPYHKKHIFSGLYIYKLVLPEPANSQKEENKRDGTPTGCSDSAPFVT